MTDHIVFPYLLEHRARTTPNRTFLREIDGVAETYAESYQATTQWAGALRALGTRAGEHVATMLPNSASAVHVWLALNGIGAVEVPIHNDYQGKMLAHVLRTCAARIAVVDARFLPRLAAQDIELPDLETVVVVNGDAEGSGIAASVVDATAALTTVQPATPVSGLTGRDLCAVLFTSGTTGLSKGVMVTYAQLHATVVGAWPMADLGADDVYYSPLPLYHASGKVAVAAMLLTGGQVAIRERFKTDAFWHDVRATGATTACLMGGMVDFLLGQPPRAEDADTTLSKTLLIPVPPRVNEFRKRFNLRVCTVYNQTELSSPISSRGWDVDDHRSCGRLRPGYECRIADLDDQPVPPGQVGELLVRADSPWVLMSGYLGAPEKTVQLWRNQWLHTGDAFTVDEQGRYYFVDRLKDVIRRRGENISSMEVESHVLDHPGVLECAAIPVPSEYGEDEVKIVIVPRPGQRIRPEELIEFLRPRMPQFMIPRYVDITDRLPKTPTEKIRKNELAAQGVTATTWDRERSQGDRAAAPARHRDRTTPIQ